MTHRDGFIITVYWTYGTTSFSIQLKGTTTGSIHHYSRASIPMLIPEFWGRVTRSVESPDCQWFWFHPFSKPPYIGVSVPWPLPGRGCWGWCWANRCTTALWPDPGRRSPQFSEQWARWLPWSYRVRLCFWPVAVFRILPLKAFGYGWKVVTIPIRQCLSSSPILKFTTTSRSGHLYQHHKK